MNWKKHKGIRLDIACGANKQPNWVGMAGFANVLAAQYKEIDETMWIYIKATR